MQKTIFLTCFVLEITRRWGGGGGNFYPPHPFPNHLTSIKKPNQNRVTVAMVRSNWRGLDCGSYTILGESLVREADGGGGNTIQGLLSSNLHIL